LSMVRAGGMSASSVSEPGCDKERLPLRLSNRRELGRLFVLASFPANKQMQKHDDWQTETVKKLEAAVSE
jgi:hypothetical protein